MNRTSLMLTAAGALAILALVAGRGGPAPTAPWNPARGPGATLDPTRVRPGTGSPPPVAAGVAASGRSAQGPVTLSVQASNSHGPAGDSQLYLQVDVAADRAEVREGARAPVNLAVVLDHSGSMQGTKLQQAKEAAQAVIGQLQDGDRLTVVAFSSGVRTSPSVAIDARTREVLADFVDGIQASGGTNISTALEVATQEIHRYAGAYKVSRVILVSDGQPTEGLTRDADILAVVDRARAAGVSTSAMGVGLDFNGPLMSAVADRGAGAYAFIEDAQQLSMAFAAELRGASTTVARKVSVTIVPRPGVEVEAVVGRQWQRAADAARVSLYDLSPGQSSQLLVRVRVRNAPDTGAFALANVELDYVDLASDAPRRETVELSLGGAATAADVAGTQVSQVVEFARRADVAVQLEQARSAYEAGDVTKALSITGNIRSLFGMSADALAGTSLDDVDQSFRAGGSQGARASKDLTLKTMKNFGANNASSY